MAGPQRAVFRQDDARLDENRQSPTRSPATVYWTLNVRRESSALRAWTSGQRCARAASGGGMGDPPGVRHRRVLSGKDAQCIPGGRRFGMEATRPVGVAVGITATADQ